MIGIYQQIIQSDALFLRLHVHNSILQEAQKKALKVSVETNSGSFVVTDPKGFSVTVTMTSKAMEADATAASITGTYWS